MKKNKNWPVLILLSGMLGAFLSLFRQYIWSSVKLVLINLKLLNPFSLMVLLVGLSIFILGLILERSILIADSSKKRVYNKILIILMCFLAPFIFSIVVDFLLQF